MSRLTHNWYPISGTHKDNKCSRKWLKLINSTSGSILENSLKMVSHLQSVSYKWYLSYKRWFHKWSSILSDH